jgi:hypothetical protein
MSIIVKQGGYTTVAGDPQNLVDGNNTTGWTPAAQAPSGGLSNGYIQFDFGTQVTLSAFSALFANSNSYGTGRWLCSDFDATVSPFDVIHDGDQIFDIISGSVLGSGTTMPLDPTTPSFVQTRPRRYFRLLGGNDPTTGATDGTELFEFTFNPTVSTIKPDTTNGNRLSGTSGTLTYTTNSVDEILLLLVNSMPTGGGATPTLVSSVTDTNGLTWSKRSDTTGPLGWTPGGNTVDTVEVWWAAVPTATSGTITVNWPSPGVQIASVSTLAVTGVADLTSPWDPNFGLPATASFSSLTSGATSTPSVTFSTSGTSFVIGVFGTSADGNNSTPNGWLSINANNGSSGSFQCTNDSIGQTFSEAQTGTVVSMGSAASTWVMVVDALATLPPPPGLHGWNPADKATEITLSNSNATATSTNHVNGYAVRGVTAHSTGKWYIEFQDLVVDPAQTDDYVGFASLPEPLETSGFSSTSQITYLSAGSNFSDVAFSFTTGLPAYSGGGHTVCMAVDFDNNLAWVRIDNGNWNSTTTSQDPSSGISSFNRTISNTEWYPFASLRSVSDAATLAETPAEFLYTPPTGFNPWGGLTNFWASTDSPDTMSAAGTVGFPGAVANLEATESPDVFAAVGHPAVTAIMAVTDGRDTFSAFGSQPQRLAMAVTEAPDTFVATGIGLGEDGVWVSTEALDIFVASGSVPFSGSFVTTDPADRFSALGAGALRTSSRRQFFVT